MFEKVIIQKATASRALRVFSTVILAAAVAAAVAIGTAMGATGKASALKACGFMTTDGGASVENVKVVDKGAANVRGTFVFAASGVREVKPLRLGVSGVGFLSFPVTSAGTSMIAIRLSTTPTTSQTFHFTLRPLPSDEAAKNGCTPR
jgi:hypothetical protein